MSSIILIDGHNLLYRAFYARNLKLSTSDNLETHACFTFTKSLLKIRKDFNTSSKIGVFFDSPTSLYTRRKLYSDYKAHRKKPEPSLYSQIDLSKNLTKYFGFAIIEKEGHETDDCIASYCNSIISRSIDEPDPLKIVIVSNDKDFIPLLKSSEEEANNQRSSHYEVLLYDSSAKSKGNPFFTEASVLEKYSVRPKQFADFLSLTGDSVDNIPGVPKVGKVTASKLLMRYGSLDNLLQNHLDEEPKIRDHMEELLLSRKLVQLNKDIPVTDEDIRNLEIKPFDPLLVPMLQRLQFQSIITMLEKNYFSKSLNRL